MTSLKVAYEGGMCGDGFSTISKAQKEQHEQYLKSMAEAFPNDPAWKLADTPTPTPSPTSVSTPVTPVKPPKVSRIKRLYLNVKRYFCCVGTKFHEMETKIAELEKKIEKENEGKIEKKITFEEFLNEFESGATGATGATEEKGAQSIIDHKKHAEDRSFGTDCSYEEAKEVCKKEVDELEDAYQAALAKRGLMAEN